MNYLFYDYETSGTCEKFDQVFQFAAIKTDHELNQIGEPIEYFCKLRTDILPSPFAIKTNQVDVNELNSMGLCEFEFAKKVCEVLLGNGKQCIVGYNSKEFDNNFTRFLLYRNFHDPYSWASINGNSCLDLLDMLRLGYSFGRLNGICVTGDGSDSLRLEDLAKWNGLAHRDAHNALSDVEATIQLAKLIKEKCPKLFEYVVGLRTFSGVSDVLADDKIFFHSSPFYGYDNKFLGMHYPICKHPKLSKSLIGWNLKHDPLLILEYSPSKIREQLYAKRENREFEVGFEELKLNKSPMITKYFTGGEKLVNGGDVCTENLAKVRSCLPDLAALASEVYESKISATDPDADLYSGDFFGEVNREIRLIEAVRVNPLNVEETAFKSARFARLLRRLKARNYLDKVCEDHQSKYKQFCRDKFACTAEDKWRTRAIFDREFAAATAADLSDKQRHCLSVLRNYADAINCCNPRARRLRCDHQNNE